MKTFKVDCVVVGGGPAGLAAAVKAKKEGLDVLIIERDHSLGGILQQCIHDGFGIVRFNKRMTGGQYAQNFIREVKALDIPVKLNTMVLDLNAEKVITAVNPDDGLFCVKAKTVILTMGCRERTRAQVLIYGDRPAGVLTAGAVQRYINMEGYLPGKEAVILGSGDIGLIMARRMTLEGINVKGVYEVMPNLGGLTRNKVQCLDDYDIPLHLSTTVRMIHGKNHIEGVTVVKVDERMEPIEGSEEYIPCDLLVLSVGLIPENELSEKAGIEMDPVTKGPVVNDEMMTSVPGIFAAGNVATVFDLVDYVSLTGELAAEGAVHFIQEGQGLEEETIPLLPGENVAFVFPQKIRVNTKKEKIPVFFRVRHEAQNVNSMIIQSTDKKKIRKHLVVKPPEMVYEKLKVSELDLSSSVTIGMEG